MKFFKISVAEKSKKLLGKRFAGCHLSNAKEASGQLFGIEKNLFEKTYTFRIDWNDVAATANGK